MSKGLHLLIMNKSTSTPFFLFSFIIVFYFLLLACNFFFNYYFLLCRVNEKGKESKDFFLVGTADKMVTAETETEKQNKPRTIK